MADETGESLALEAGETKPARVRHARKLADYEAIYGTKVRQMKNWRKIGQALTPPQLPPLDEPEEMVQWWARAYPERNVPEKIMQAANRAKAAKLAGEATCAAPPVADSISPAKTKSAPPAGNSETDPASTARARIEAFEQVDGLTLESAALRMRKTLAILMRDQEAALCNPNSTESEMTMRANRVDKCIERLRKIEGTLDEQRKLRGDLVDRAEAREDLQRVHTAMAGSLESRLVDALGIDRAKARTIIDDWFTVLRQSRFFSDALPTAAAPNTVAA